jgi:hypothetical protein
MTGVGVVSNRNGGLRRALATGVALLATLGADAGFAGVGDDCPPNAEPGKCYEKVYRPEQYETYTEQVIEQPSHVETRMIDAVYRFEEREVLVREARSEAFTVPASYRTVTETVVVRPASVRRQSVLAVYETVTEQVLVRAARTEWRRGVLLDRQQTAPGTTMMSPTGEVMCLVEIPAEYRTETRRVLRTPARIIEVTEPAETQTVTREVLVTPSHVEWRETPAEYRRGQERVLVTPAHVERYQAPAVYRTEVRQRRIREASFGWQVISCDYGAPAKRVGL